jgi:hypothetical protein
MVIILSTNKSKIDPVDIFSVELVDSIESIGIQLIFPTLKEVVLTELVEGESKYMVDVYERFTISDIISDMPTSDDSIGDSTVSLGIKSLSFSYEIDSDDPDLLSKINTLVADCMEFDPTAMPERVLEKLGYADGFACVQPIANITRYVSDNLALPKDSPRTLYRGKIHKYTSTKVPGKNGSVMYKLSVYFSDDKRDVLFLGEQPGALVNRLRKGKEALISDLGGLLFIEDTVS